MRRVACRPPADQRRPRKPPPPKRPPKPPPPPNRSPPPKPPPPNRSPPPNPPPPNRSPPPKPPPPKPPEWLAKLLKWSSPALRACDSRSAHDEASEAPDQPPASDFSQPLPVFR